MEISEIMDGSLLGDGYVKVDKHKYFTFSQTSKDKKFLENLKEIFKVPVQKMVSIPLAAEEEKVSAAEALKVLKKFKIYYLLGYWFMPALPSMLDCLVGIGLLGYLFILSMLMNWKIFPNK